MKTKYLLLVPVLILSSYCFSQIPILNSNPGITNKVIYLDFDGQLVSGTGWNSGNIINALPSTFNANAITLVWQRVSEDYRPFDVNITTDVTRFNTAPANRRIRVVITPTSAWYGNSAGGVAYVGSFTWGGTPGTPCWIFENMLGNSVKSVAEACSHEVGHTLTLRHQSTYNSSCTKTAEYNGGQGSGVTGWAPIMGVGYSRNVTTWYNGKSTSGCNIIQDDHGSSGIGITSPGFLSFLPDDVGDTYATAKILNLTMVNLQDSGIITTPTDIDAYQFTICNNRYVSFSAKPWALDTVNYSAANLDIRFKLYNATNSLVAIDTTLSRLHTLTGINLTPGSYYFTIDGGRSNNYSDYGSLGKYYINIKALNPPVLANSIITPTNICMGQNITFSVASNGVPTTWQWNVSGTSTLITSSQANPTINFTTAGIYTISLLATSTASASCETTKLINVGVLPNVSVSPGSTTCPTINTALTASGAATYVWMPGSLAGSTHIVSPAVTTAYTVTGSNGMCSNSAVTTVTVSPDFTLNVSATQTLSCPLRSITLTASGATGYTFYPVAITGSVAVVSPSVPTIYSIVGSNGICSKSVSKYIAISPAFTLHVHASDTLFCAGKTITITAGGANTYTFNPGGITSNPAIVSPTANVTYTITGTNATTCLQDITRAVETYPCDFTGVAAHDANDQLSIYPNPASSDITIVTGLSCTKIEVISAPGSLIFEKNISDDKPIAININDWAKGIYFVRAYSGNNTLSVQKLIIR